MNEERCTWYDEPGCIKVIGWRGDEPQHCGKVLEYAADDYCIEHQMCAPGTCAECDGAYEDAFGDGP